MKKIHITGGSVPKGAKRLIERSGLSIFLSPGLDGRIRLFIMYKNGDAIVLERDENVPEELYTEDPLPWLKETASQWVLANFKTIREHEGFSQIDVFCGLVS